MDKINHDITEIILQHVAGSTPTTYGDMIKHLEYYTKQSHSLGYAEGLRDAREIVEKGFEGNWVVQDILDKLEALIKECK